MKEQERGACYGGMNALVAVLVYLVSLSVVSSLPVEFVLLRGGGCCVLVAISVSLLLYYYSYYYYYYFYYYYYYYYCDG